jgi:hypothetical protein
MKCRRGRKRIYSEKLDACIQVETKLFGPSVQVRDLTQTVITDGISIYGALLLHCDIDGVDRVKIDVVRELRGRVHSVPYARYLDDGVGGPPRALKTPDQPFSRQDCENVLKSWLSAWR